MLRRFSPYLVAVVLLGGYWMFRVRALASLAAFGGDDALHALWVFPRHVGDLLFGAWAHRHPPLYFVFLEVVSWFGRDEATLRWGNHLVVPACLGVGYLYGTLVGGRRTGLFFALFLICSRMILFQTFELRGYLLAILFILIAGVLFERWVRSSSPREFAWAILASLCSILTEYGAVLLTLPLVASYFLRKTWDRPRGCWPYVLSAGPAFLALAVLCFVKTRGERNLRDTFYLEEFMFRGQSVVSGLNYFFDVWTETVEGHLPGGIWGAAAIYLGSLALVVRSWSFFVFLAGPVLGSAFLAVMRLYPGGAQRHTMVVLIPILLTSALGVNALLDRVQKWPVVERALYPIRPWCNGVFALLYLIIGIVALEPRMLQVSYPRQTTRELDQATSRLITLLSAGEIVVLDYATAITFEYQLVSGKFPEAPASLRSFVFAREWIVKAPTFCAGMQTVFKHFPKAERGIFFSFIADAFRPKLKRSLAKVDRVGGSVMVEVLAPAKPKLDQLCAVFRLAPDAYPLEWRSLYNRRTVYASQGSWFNDKAPPFFRGESSPLP